MARNETFRAKQVEKMSALMASLKTEDENLGKMVKYGLDSLSRHTHLSPDEDKTDRSFKGVVEKFEMNNYMAQVNDLEECYDNWIDYPLGEKKERESPLHYHIIEFLLNLANEPIKAAELQDPVKKEETIESDTEQAYDSEEDEIFDPAQWRDDDTLSDWSDEELIPSKPKTKEELQALLAHPDLAMGDDEFLDLPTTPIVEQEMAEPVKEEDLLAKIRAHLDLSWGDIDSNGNLPPWQKFDDRRSISDVVRPIIPNNVTHDTIKQLISVEQEGISDKGWTIYHERQIIRNICFYGQGYFLKNKGSLFDWDEERQMYKVKEKLGMTHITPGSLRILLEDFAIFASQMRRIHQFINKKEERTVPKFFIRRFRCLVDARIGVYCRRAILANRQKEHSISLLIWRRESSFGSIFEEATFFDNFVSSIREDTCSDQYAINLIGTIVSYGQELSYKFGHLVSLWTDLLIWTLYPWVDLIDDLTTMNGFSRKYNTTIHAAFFADFPINVSLKLDNNTTWEKIATPKSHLKWPSILAPIEKVLKLVTEGIRSKLLMQSLEDVPHHPTREPGETLFKKFEQNAYDTNQVEPEVLPNDAFWKERKIIGHKCVIDKKNIGLETERDPLMRKFITDLVEKIGTYPVREEFVERRDYSTITRTNVWSVLPIVQFLSDNWMLPVIQSIEETTTSFIQNLNHSNIMSHIESGMDVFLNRTGMIDDIAIIIADSTDQDKPNMIDVNGLFKSDHFVARLKSNFQLEISYAPPPPACYIFSAEIIADYNKIANYLLQLKLASIQINRNHLTMPKDQSYPEKMLLMMHLREIIQNLTNFIFLGLFQRHDCDEKISRAKTLESIICVHREMVHKLMRSLMLAATNQESIRTIMAELQGIIRMPLEFPFDQQLKPITKKRFFQRCAFLRQFFVEFAQIEKDSNMRKWMESLANSLYYTLEDFDMRKRQKCSNQMIRHERFTMSTS